MKTYTIHLIRHGLTQGNVDGTYTGHRDLELLPEGKKELQELKEAYVYPEVPVVFSSPLQRCRQTASLLYPDNEILILDDFIEYNFGEFEGCSAEDLKDNEDFKNWLYGDGTVAPPHGETNKEFTNRVVSGFVKVVDGLMKTGITEAAIISHGGVIMTIMAIFALPEAPMTDWMMGNGAGYTLRITPTLWGQTGKAEAVAQVPYTPEDLEDDYRDLTDFEHMAADTFTIAMDENITGPEDLDKSSESDPALH